MSNELLTTIIHKLQERIHESSSYCQKQKGLDFSVTDEYFAGYSEAMEDAIYIISEMIDNER